MNAFPQRRCWMAIGLAVLLCTPPAQAFRVEAAWSQTQDATQGWAVPPWAQPPFIHWDLREFPSCRIPYAYVGGTTDVAGDGEFTATDAGFTLWEAVTPASIRFRRVAPGAGAHGPGHFDGYNVLGWVGGAAGGTSGDDAWLVPPAAQACGTRVVPGTPIIGPGPDGWLTSSANACTDDQCLQDATPCQCGRHVGAGISLVSAGVDGVLQTAPRNCMDDVCDAAVAPCACGDPVTAHAVLIRPGPNGVLESTPRSCGGGDDVIVGGVIIDGGDETIDTVVAAGDDAVAGGLIKDGGDGIIDTALVAGDDAYTPAGTITAGPNGIVESVPSGNPMGFIALTTVFYDLATGRILEGDVIANDNYTWQVTPAGADMHGQPDVTMIMAHEMGHLVGLHHPTAHGRVNPPDPPGGALNPLMSPGVFLNDDVWIGGAGNDVCWTPVGIQAPIIGAGSDGVVLLGVNLNNCPLGDDEYDPVNNVITAGADGLVDSFLARDRVRTTLDVDDEDGANFLYTHDMGDAPDMFKGIAFNRYPTLVRTSAGTGRMLNDQQLWTPAAGPVHLYGFAGGGPSGDTRFEWLGATADQAAEECDPFVPDLDVTDDGVVLPAMPIPRGTTQPFVVTVSTTNRAGRYSTDVNDDEWLVDPPNQQDGGVVPLNGPIIDAGADGVLQTAPGAGDRIDPGPPRRIVDDGNARVDTTLPTIREPRLNLNVYFDFDGDAEFGDDEFIAWWSGVPAPAGSPAGTAPTTVASSPNIVSITAPTPTTIALTVNVRIPRSAANEFYARFRLDWGEDDGTVADVNGDLRRAKGVAQFGEVEDYRIETRRGELPDFLCYEVKRLRVPVIEGVNLTDQFGTTTGRLTRVMQVCTPVAPADEPLDPMHLVSYRLRHPWDPVERARITTRFGTTVQDVWAPDTLMLPVLKSLTPFPAISSTCGNGVVDPGEDCDPPGAAGCPPGETRLTCHSNCTCPPNDGIDHFECYDVRPSDAAHATPAVTGLDVRDQFGRLTLDLRWPATLCAPVDKNGETPGAETHPEHLLCYRIRTERGFGDTWVWLNDQFGLRKGRLVRRQHYCVPATKELLQRASGGQPLR